MVSLNPLNKKIDTAPIMDVNDKYTSIMNSISHEIRTQMNSIDSLAFLLKDDSLDETKKNDLINHIHLISKQLITMFENFTELEYGVNKNIEENEEKCSITSLLAPLFDEFRAHLIKCGKHKVELVNEIQNTNMHEVIINKINVYKIFRCLFLNSLQNTEFGYIKIGFYKKNNEYLTFYLRDSGNGYEKTKELLYSKDIKSSLKQYNDLYAVINIFLAKKLIHALHGIVEINNNGTNGTEVYFTIPIKNADKPKLPFYKYLSSIFLGHDKN